eukprot:scaffold110255_cov60-Phaeocystis_antarctica.AAC.4
MAAASAAERAATPLRRGGEMRGAQWKEGGALLQSQATASRPPAATHGSAPRPRFRMLRLPPGLASWMSALFHELATSLIAFIASSCMRAERGDVIGGGGIAVRSSMYSMSASTT